VEPNQFVLMDFRADPPHSRREAEPSRPPSSTPWIWAMACILWKKPFAACASRFTDVLQRHSSAARRSGAWRSKRSTDQEHLPCSDDLPLPDLSQGWWGFSACCGQAMVHIPAYRFTWWGPGCAASWGAAAIAACAQRSTSTRRGWPQRAERGSGRPAGYRKHRHLSNLGWRS